MKIEIEFGVQAGDLTEFVLQIFGFRKIMVKCPMCSGHFIILHHGERERHTKCLRCGKHLSFKINGDDITVSSMFRL